MDERYEPADVEVRREEGVTITYQDGFVAEFDLETLRKGCPCATCRSIRDTGRPSWPLPGRSAALKLQDAEFHGAWALRLVWTDGHGTGVFPFESLRRWHEDGVPILPDSGLGGAGI